MGDCFREVYERWVTGRSWADLDLDSLGNLNPEVSNGTFEFGMPEQQLYHPKVPGPPVNQGLRTPHRVRPVRRFVKPDLSNPAVNDPAVLPGR